MSKYSLSFKLEVVQHYLSGMEGQKATAKRFGIDHSAVRKWTAAWKLHGEAGLTTRHFAYSPVFKESVILHMREHRLSVREVCDEREELEQLRVEVAYLKKLQALLREKSTSKRGIKRRS